MKRRILIVDDSAVERTMLAGFLKKDYDTLEAKSGVEALALLAMHYRVISAVVLDIVMPEMDGFETMRRIRETLLYQQIPIIVTTGLEDDESRARAVAYGANGFITKPYNRSLLLHAVQNAIKLQETAAVANSLWKDSLTGLLNRGAFLTEAERLLRRHESGYYVMSCLNIENFKAINALYGTEVGDQVLRHVGDCVNEFIGSFDGIACHSSADKFAVLYPSSLKDTEKLRQNHLLVMRPQCIQQDIRIRVGRYIVDDLTLAVSAMYDRAALAEASLKNRYDSYIAYYTDEMHESYTREQQIINDMAAALREDRFEPWLQPQYNHATGAMVGAEALVRWNKDGRYISPAFFIPIFEANGFIYEMDQCIWKKVCALLRRWIDMGLSPLPVSVNISRRDLQHESFLYTLTSIVAEYAVPFELLRLEVTESAFADAEIIEKVNALISMGFTVEIDDFGSGYSSLNTLKDVPASILKLDMKFFENTGNVQRGGNIVESVVRMAKWLDMAVIAEGVEDMAQADYLKSIGCNYIQGYLYSRPVPAAEYEAMMLSGDREPKLAGLKTLETLDNNEFWNPKSMETLIFNSYIGGACIFEYHNGTAELLRSNDQYAREFGSIVPTAMLLTDAAMADYLDEKGQRLLRETIDRADKNRRQASCEIILSDGEHTEYIRTTVRVIARAGERKLCYAVVQNMTAQRVAQRRRLEAERKQSESVRKLEVIMGNINGGVSAIIIRDDASSTMVFNNARYYELYGYTEEQAQAEKLDVLTRILPEDLPEVMEKIRRLKASGEPTLIDYRIRRRDGTLAYLRANSSLMRLDGYDEDIITSVLTDITEKRSLEEQLRAIVDNINGGVTATVFRGGQPEFVIVNDQFFRMLGYDTRAAFEAACGSDKYACIHPDDRQRVQSEYESCGGGREKFTMEYRVIRSDGQERDIRNNISIISLFGVEGPVRLSVVNDITAEKRAERRQKELLDNLPCGTALYEYDGQTLKVIHINKRYWDLVNRRRDNYRDGAVLELVHPDDVHLVKQELDAAIRQQRDFSACLRIRSGTSGWTRFRVTAAVTEKAQGLYTLYTSYMPVTGESMNVQEMLPIALSTVMSSSGDFSYVKDRQGRYMCCSRAVADMLGLADVRDIVGKTDFDLFDRDLAESFAANDRRIFETGRAVVDYEADVPYKAGGYCYARTSMYPLLDAEGAVIGIYGVSRDVSKEQMLNFELNTLLYTIPSGVFKYAADESGQLAYVNRSFIEALGYTERSFRETFHNSFREMVWQGDRERVDSEIKAQERDGEIGHFDFRIPAADGSLHWFHDEGTMITDQDGKSWYYVNLVDISDRVEAERRQQQLLDSLKLMTDSMPTGLATYVGSDRAIRLTYCNAGFRRLLGVGEDDLAAVMSADPLTYIYPDDREKLLGQFRVLTRDDTPIDCVYRIVTVSDQIRWVHERAVITGRFEGTLTVNAVFFDITEQQEALEKLRISEEVNRLAMEQSGRIVTRFDVRKRTLLLPESFDPIFKVPRLLENMPEEQIALGRVSPETAHGYREMFNGIIAGSAAGAVTYQQLSTKGWRWLKAQYTTVFSDEGEPVSAVVSFTDITQQLEKELVYSKWQQSLESRRDGTYTLFRCNLSKDAAFESREGSLVDLSLFDPALSFTELSRAYAGCRVYPADRAAFSAFVNSDAMLAGYYRGRRADAMEYRELGGDGSLRWIRLSAEMVEYPNSRDVELYLLFEDITDTKLEELQTKELAQTDALTGVLNRTTFIARMGDIASSGGPEAVHALLIADIDGFKEINDRYGHAAGDAVLRALTASMGAVLRREDLLGRLGGDEFLIFLKNVGSAEAAGRKAKQLCALGVTPPGSDARVTLSIGVAMLPRDGTEFGELYKKVDAAMYAQKRGGKNGYHFVADQP